MPVLSSPRSRRRAAWIAACLVAAAATAAAVVALPKGTPERETLRPGAPQVVHTSRSVHLTQARRRTIDELLDAFVPAPSSGRDR